MQIDGALGKPYRLRGARRLLGSTASGGVSAPASYLGQVATRSVIPSDASTTNTQFMCRTSHVARQALTSLQVMYGAWFPDTGVTGQELPSTANLTVKVSVEYNGAILGTFLWGGTASGVITAGTNRLSDALTLSGTIPDGATFFLRAFITSTAAKVPYTTSGGNGDAIFLTGESCLQGTTGVTDLTAATGTFAGTNVTQNIYPVAIVAQTTKRTYFLLGDSRMVGSRGTPNAAGNFGQAAISVGPTNGYIVAGCSGDRAYWFSRYPDKRLEAAAFCSHVIVGYPINDIRSGGAVRTLAQAKSDMANVWSMFPGKPIIQLTAEPWSTSTDSFATTANQTTDTSNPVRTALNDYIRTVPAPLAGVADIATVVESAVNSGIWKANYTTEGGHPSNTGYTAIGSSGVIAPATMDGLFPVSQLWSPETLFPKGTGTADIAQWVVADEETCTGPTTQIIFGKNNEFAWSQATAAKQPVREAAVINGRKAWRFTLANAQEVTGSTSTKTLTNGQPGLLMAAVIRYNGGTGLQQQIIFNSRNGSGVSNRASLIVDATSKVFTAVRRAEADTGANQTGSTTLQTGSDYIILAQIDLTTNTVRLRINGADEAVTGTAVPTGSGNWPATAAAATAYGSTNNAAALFNGWLAEALQIPGIQTLADMQKIEGRMATLYGITLPVGHPYQAGPPTV